MNAKAQNTPASAPAALAQGHGTSAPAQAPTALPDPPHGGRFVRNADGTLTCTATTAPAAGRPGASAPQPIVTETPEE